MAARVRWLCWCCCGDGYRPSCEAGGIVKRTCDECDGRGWYYELTDKPGRHVTLEAHLEWKRMRPETCGGCQYFRPEQVGRKKGKPCVRPTEHVNPFATQIEPSCVYGRKHEGSAPAYAALL